MWHDQAKWVGSWYRHVTGFLSLVLFKHVNADVQNQALVASSKYTTDVTYV